MGGFLIKDLVVERMASCYWHVSGAYIEIENTGPSYAYIDQYLDYENIIEDDIYDIGEEVELILDSVLVASVGWHEVVVDGFTVNRSAETIYRYISTIGFPFQVFKNLHF